MLRRNIQILNQFSGRSRDDLVKQANQLVRDTLAQNGIASGFGHADDTNTDTQKPDVPVDIAEILNKALKPLRQGAVNTMFDAASFQDDISNRKSFVCDAGSREYELYVPQQHEKKLTGLIVMLHGCTQTPSDFATGTGMNSLADQHGFAVVYPAQSRGANAQTCWNWFNRGDQRTGRGEPEIIAALTRELIRTLDIPKSHVFVGGLSAGGAMAVILGQCYPGIFSGVGVHSGLPYGAAHDVPSAFAAMSGNYGSPIASGSRSSFVPTIVFHGSADTTVQPMNGDEIIRGTLSSNSDIQVQTLEENSRNGRTYGRKVTSGSDGQTIAEHWVISDLGHAWSGGNPAGSYSDAKGPKASEEMVRFFFEARSERDRNA